MNTNILTIPADALIAIIGFMHHHSVLSLHSTCRKLYSVITPDILATSYAKTRAIMLAEEIAEVAAIRKTYDLYNDSEIVNRLINRPLRLNCYRCLHSLPAAQFGREQVIRGKKLGAKTAVERTCCDCAIKAKKYSPGMLVQMSNFKLLVICVGCGQAKLVPGGRKTKSAFCNECLTEEAGRKGKWRGLKMAWRGAV